tara:strand:- start:159 stop:650 length:492 start_codon:yes stop_codon:yes gene_type:complete
MPQYPRKQKIQRLRGGFKRALPIENYNKLVHFVIVDKLLKPCPGDYVCYRYYKTCIGVATSEPDINEWLELHDSAPRTTVNTKYGRKGKVLEQAIQNGYSKFGTVEGVMQTSEQLQDEIMRCLEDGETLSSIGKRLGCTVPNVHYHKRKYKERMAKELEVDKT